MPDRNDTGGARKCSGPALRVQVCGLPLLRPLWLNRSQGRVRIRATTRAARPRRRQ